MSISAKQSKAARALIGWSRRQLAEASHVSERTLIDFERGARAPHRRTLVDLRRALEEAGVIFIDENEEGAGVRLRKSRDQ
jgi:transcriptional regulator with XRE-family HTH domain